MPDAHVHPRVDRTMAQLMGWTAYVAAPLLVGSQVVGVIHADRGRGQSLDVLDRDVLWEFATGLALHVNSILRKLNVANRAEAVARYLHLLGMCGP